MVLVIRNLHKQLILFRGVAVHKVLFFHQLSMVESPYMLTPSIMSRKKVKKTEELSLCSFFMGKEGMSD